MLDILPATPLVMVGMVVNKICLFPTPKNVLEVSPKYVPRPPFSAIESEK